MLDDEQMLFWKYNVPMNVACKTTYNKDCPICEGDENLREWLPRFLIAEVPTDILQKVIKKKFNIIVDSVTLNKHRHHFMVEYFTDEEIKSKAIEDFVAIESDLPKAVNEKQAMETAMRMLYAKILQMKNDGNTGKEFLMAVHEIKALIEMKLKLKRDLPEDGVKLDLKDLIKIEQHDGEGSGNSKKADK